MVVAPWILPLRALVFGSLISDRKLLFRALITLATGVVVTTLLSTGLGLIARSNGLLILDSFPEEITARLEPTLLDLGIALAAGAIATYAKVESWSAEYDGHSHCGGHRTARLRHGHHARR